MASKTRLPRLSTCDLNNGWSECWNTACRWHGKDAKVWHALVKQRLCYGNAESSKLEAEVHQRLTRIKGKA